MDFMKKMAFSEMEKAMVASNLVGEKLYGIIVFTRDSFSRYYTLEERSYLVDNMTSMHFQPGAASGAIVGDCLDEADFGARLDRCMKEEGWVPEYCYLVEHTCRYCKYLHSLKPDSEAYVCNMGWIISPLCLDKKKCKDWKCKELREEKHVTKSCYYFAEVPEPGSLSASIVHPREVMVEAVKTHAASIILVHNHPSGDPTPSREDTEITEQLVKAGKVLCIPVLDHIIVGLGKFFSFKGKGLIG